MAFETKYACGDCSHIFYKITDFDPRKKGGRIPSCPECRKRKKMRASGYIKVSGDVKQRTVEEDGRKIQEIIEKQKFPASGGSNFTKAMDATADIVMQDYGLTNLQDNLRAGDSMAPKLEARLERKVDEVFKPQKPIAGMQAAQNLNKTLMRQINQGAFKGYGGSSDVVARQQSSGFRPKTNVLFEHNRGDKTH